MKLTNVRVQNYRSIRDTGNFSVEETKTIMVGPNEAGKTAILQALQQINPPDGVKPFNALRDYPRALYNDIATKKIDPSKVTVVTAWFKPDINDLQEMDESYKSEDNRYVFERRLDNTSTYYLTQAPGLPTYGEVKSDLLRLAAHLDRETKEGAVKAEGVKLTQITASWTDKTELRSQASTPLLVWLEAAIPLIDEENEKEVSRRDEICRKIKAWDSYVNVAHSLEKKIPKFILFSNIYRVKPNIHLAHLAARLSSGAMDDEYYDYGNSCLLKLLGFTAEQLSTLGRVADPAQGNATALESFRDQLDSRNYQLNAASIRLSSEIRKVWNPDEKKHEASKLRLVADGQYLKVVVEDSEGVEVELDQRSEGFQWLVSFFVVFFSESDAKHANSILLLDEPGVSLHALKQRDFRGTVSRLAAHNQTIYTTHSPFMVGPDELDLVRVVEMTDRSIGTKVNTSITSSDPAALLPLQEALGYDLAQSLFSQQKNLVLEGLTDYWYLEATAALLAQSGIISLTDKVALIPSNTASKVVYFATILAANNLKVAALLDSDNAGDQAAKQEVLVHKLGNKKILRTADFTSPKIEKAEIEDLLRLTLAEIAVKELTIDVRSEIKDEPNTPIVDILNRKGAKNFKYKLAKAYIKWTRDNDAENLAEIERQQWASLISAVNRALS